MLVDFVIGSLLCSERFFGSRFSGFVLSSKTNNPKFDPGIRGHTLKGSQEESTVKCFMGKQITYNDCRATTIIGCTLLLLLSTEAFKESQL